MSCRHRLSVDPACRVAAPGVRGLAGADPQRVRPGRRQGDGANGEHLVLVEDGLERRAVVGGLPHAAVARRDVDRVEVRLGWRVGHGDVGDPGPGPVRTEVSPGESREQMLVKRRGFDWRLAGDRGYRRSQGNRQGGDDSSAKDAVHARSRCHVCRGTLAAAIAAPRRTRATERSRPSNARVSNIPGLAALPVTATRVAWMSVGRLQGACLGEPRITGSSVAASKGVVAASVAASSASGPAI